MTHVLNHGAMGVQGPLYVLTLLPQLASDSRPFHAPDRSPTRSRNSKLPKEIANDDAFLQ